MIVVVKPQVRTLTVVPSPVGDITIPTSPASISAFSDILLTNLVENQVLTYTSGKWQNKDAVAAQDSNFVYNQGSASSNWVITHNLSKYPSVVVIDSAGDEVDGSITYTDTQQLTIVFSASFSGKAYLN